MENIRIKRGGGKYDLCEKKYLVVGDFTAKKYGFNDWFLYLKTLIA